MTIKIIKNEAEYDQALDRADAIFDARPGTPEGDELELLLLVIKAYEDEHHPVPPPDPIDAIKLTMEEQGIKAAELTQRMGVSKSYVSQLLSRRKPLTASMMRLLHRQLGIPAEILLG
ncbi:helix-turn-helix domain-containing protein [Spirosoma montaniterrae]|uniref:Transcriptional regulator n=1 Tax=Spirosoma montaniterrae TaxID=1178516 RepID=A0A1P9X2C6_9BACT|nr:helix-turn-helix domain-containing protein [Spirosoma montaniterrae]AQG81771.1 transcriptional regulator [Spirosoma montaniterrae]